jgi:soluble lytic murein transglycosylase
MRKAGSRLTAQGSGLLVAAALCTVLAPHPVAQQPQQPQQAAPTLVPTNHPKVPRDLSRLWLAPDRIRPAPATFTNFATAVKLEAAGEHTRALTLLTEPALQQSPLGNYAAYYAAKASLKLGRNGDAVRAFQALEARQPVGYLAEAAAIGEAEADEAQNDFRAAAGIYERLLRDGVGAVDDISMRLGNAAKAGGDTTKASDAFARVYYDNALSELAPSAGAELARLSTLEPIAPGNDRYKKELARAGKIFDARLYAPARAAFQALAAVAAKGDDGELVNLRVAECDYFLKHSRMASDEVRPFIDHASRKGEALFFHGAASLDLNDRPEFTKTMRRVADEFPSESWAEEALDSLANFNIQKADNDEEADRLLLELYTKYPKGIHAERAAWRIGWRAYRERRYAETVRVFEQASHDFPRSDYRPPWLYWAGRAHEALGEPDLAEARYKLELADYRNTYHGHLALKELAGYTPPARVILASAAGPDDPAPPFADLPPNAQTIQNLLSVNLFEPALNELRFAARAWGETSPVEATIAWVERQRGRSETGVERFNDWRGSMTIMKRAYPQYLAAGGEQLPWDVQATIFPVAYWDTIKKYSAANQLDPYIVAALTAQESTFVADIKSYAGAVGLMQFMVPDAREWAKKVGLPYSASLRANADASLKMGTSYLADLVRRFGDVYVALAAYNAGPGRVHQWMTDRPDMPQDVFIDDIPYPQTQNYVKKILATAEDYKRLYGPDAMRGQEPDLDAKLPSATVAPAAKPVAPRPAAPKATAKPAAAPARQSPKGVGRKSVVRSPKRAAGATAPASKSRK